MSEDATVSRKRTPQPLTRAEYAYDRLRAGILTGEFAPGQNLRASEVAAHLNISTTPLREALQRLAGEEEVEITPQGGARVSQISVPFILDVYRLRLLIEPLAARMSAERPTAGWRAAVESSFRDLQSTSFDVDPVEFEDAHAKFHASVISNCPSNVLKELSAQLRTKTRRYRLLTVHTRRSSGLMDHEHQAIMIAALAGNSPEVEQLTIDHLNVVISAFETPGEEVRMPFLHTVRSTVATVSDAWLDDLDVTSARRSGPGPRNV